MISSYARRTPDRPSTQHVAVARVGRPTERENLMLAWSLGSWLLWTLALVVWIAIAFWPARVAARKGHSFFGYFLLSLLFFPLAVILAYVVDDRTRPATT